MSLGKHILIYINFLSKIPNINFSVSKGPMFYFTWSSLRKWENKPNIFCSGWFCNRLNGRDLHFHFAITYIRDALAYHTYKLSRNTSTPFSCSLHRTCLFQETVSPFVRGCYPGRVGIALRMGFDVHKIVESAYSHNFILFQKSKNSGEGHRGFAKKL